jgi:hypothetical protein
MRDQDFSKTISCLTDGPNFPPPYNSILESHPSNEDKFDIRLIMPRNNIIKLYILYHHLKDNYQIDDSKLLFADQFAETFEKTLDSFGVDKDSLKCLHSCNLKVWLVVRNLIDYEWIFEKYPNFVNSTILQVGLWEEKEG